MIKHEGELLKSDQLCTTLPSDAPAGVYEMCVSGVWNKEYWVLDNTSLIEACNEAGKVAADPHGPVKIVLVILAAFVIGNLMARLTP